MMGSDRLSIFDNTDDVDLTAFQPKTDEAFTRPDPLQVRAISEAARFPSREAKPAALIREKHVPRRHKTGRTAQLNVRVRPEFFDKAYAIAEQQNWLVGETIERALDALQREIGEGGQRS